MEDRPSRPATRVRQSPARARLLRLVGWPAFVLGLVLLLVGHGGASSGPYPLLRPILCTAGGVVLLAFGRRAVLRGRRHAAEVLRSLDALPADREVVLFLRSFVDDEGFSAQQRGEQLLDYWGTTRTEEEQLAAALAPFGRVVALGQPGDVLPPAGAARHFSSDDRWREQVLAGLDRAGLVLLAAGPGDGLRWEVDQVVARIAPERVVLVVCRDAAQYESFRASTGDRFPRGLPEYRPRTPTLPAAAHAYTRAAVWFDADWTPHLRHLDGPGSARNWVASVFSRALTEVYERAGVRQPRRWRRVRPAVPVTPGDKPAVPPVRIARGRWRAERVRTGGVDFVVRVGDGVEEHVVEYRPSRKGKTAVLVDGKRVGHEFRLGPRGPVARLVTGDDVQLRVDGAPVYALTRAAAGSDTFLEHRATAIRDALLALPRALPGPFPATLRVAPELPRRHGEVVAGATDPVIAVLDTRSDFGDARTWCTDRAVHIRYRGGVVVLPHADLASATVTADYATLHVGPAALDFPGHAEHVARVLDAVRAAVLAQDSGFDPPPAVHPFVRAGALRAERVEARRKSARWRLRTTLWSPMAGFGVFAGLLAAVGIELGDAGWVEQVAVRVAAVPAGFLAGMAFAAIVVLLVDAVFLAVRVAGRVAAAPRLRLIRRRRPPATGNRRTAGRTPAPTAGRGGTAVRR
ncbi:hypothetical protein [Saccharothrix obliqua]|uniref:hypothetical protein n=1 Tax=Saccharothrix obliqua TaxID=2861747 RepID=UPI001C5E670E|nr:hypothetical protein [Saccharothrix obliqua]MBW4718157.1 hypothetical protein [Saccharothrix obliqua]